jgi:hypothetical protein
MTAALLSEHRERCGDSIQNAFDVDVDHPVPLVDIEVVKGRQRHQAGVADQYIEPAEAILRLLDKRYQVFTFADVDHVKIHLSLVLANVGGNGFKPIGATRAKNDLGSRCRQQSPGGFADSAGRSRDSDDFSLYVGHCSPVRWSDIEVNSQDHGGSHHPIGRYLH